MGETRVTQRRNSPLKVTEKELEEWERHANVGGNVRPAIARALIDEVRRCHARLGAAEKALATADELVDLAYVQSVDPRCADYQCDRDDWHRLVAGGETDG